MKQHVEISICAKCDVIWANSVGIINFWNCVVQPKFYSECMVWLDNVKNLQSLYVKIDIFDAL